MTRRATVQRALKRALDVIVSLGAFLLLAPLFLLIALAVKLDSPGPVFFTDTRIGRAERPFRMVKFRSMLHRAAEGPLGYMLVPGDPRITRVGRLLRRFSLDELPQLLNILRGDMSLVGPRPMLPAHMPHLTTEQRRRFEMRPGLTGWAQVNGRNDIPWAERIRLDIEYVDRFALGVDLRILFKTIAIVLRGSALYSDFQKRDAL